MNIKDLSLKKILGNDWTYNSEFQYEDFDGSAELHKGDRIILFRRKDKEDISAISFQAVGLCDKKLFHTERCIFKKCIFHDTFGIGYLYVFDNQFQNCLFDRIKIEMETEGTYLASNNITDCIFQNIVWVGCGLCANTMSGGKIVHVSYNERSKIEENYFSDMQMEDMEIEMKDDIFLKNRFHCVTFKNVTLKGQMEKNKFVNCDTSGFTYIPLKLN